MLSKRAIALRSRLLAFLLDSDHCLESSNWDKSVKPDNPQKFLAHLTNLKASLESTHGAQSFVQDQRSEIRFDYEALLPEADMDRILRYEERMHRHLDWAVQRLLESQERRKTLEASAGPVFPARKSVERSQ